MKVLVTAASKHGATAEIAAAIGERLSQRGFDVTVAAPEQVEGVDGYDAVVLGSGVYAGHWLKPAIELVERAGDALGVRPVWLFSIGPIGDPPKPDEDPVDVSKIRTATNARGHRIFAGKLDKTKLGFGERAMVVAFRAPFGDFRDWDEIAEWATTIADALAESSTNVE